MVTKTLNKKRKIGQQIVPLKSVMISDFPEWCTVPVLLVISFMVHLQHMS